MIPLRISARYDAADDHFPAFLHMTVYPEITQDLGTQGIGGHRRVPQSYRQNVKVFLRNLLLFSQALYHPLQLHGQFSRHFTVIPFISL